MSVFFMKYEQAKPTMVPNNTLKMVVATNDVNA
jgi:hypothetical protein